MTCSTSRLRAGFGSVGGRALGLGARERFGQPRDALAGADEGAPVRDGGFDRRERATHHDGGGDHGAGGQFQPEHEIGAKAEHHRLQQEPQHLRHAAERARDIAQAGGGADVAVVDPAPTLRQRPGHSHCHDGLAAAALGLHHDRACPGVLRCGARGAAAGAFGQQRHRKQRDAAGGRREAEPGMNEETDVEEHRNPRHVADGDGAGAGQEGADLIEVTDRLRGLAGMPGRNGKPDHGAVHGQGEALIEQHRRPDDDAGADQIENTLECVGADQEDREGDQRRHAPAAQDAVVDLQHVQRAGEHQQVHDAREQGDARRTRAGNRARRPPRQDGSNYRRRRSWACLAEEGRSSTCTPQSLIWRCYVSLREQVPVGK